MVNILIQNKKGSEVMGYQGSGQWYPSYVGEIVGGSDYFIDRLNVNKNVGIVPKKVSLNDYVRQSVNKNIKRISLGESHIPSNMNQSNDNQSNLIPKKIDLGNDPFYHNKQDNRAGHSNNDAGSNPGIKKVRKSF
jgi:hypothetical protein